MRLGNHNTTATTGYLNNNTVFSYYKRATPTVTIYNPHNGTTGQLITDANVAKTAASESIGARGGGFIYANNASVTISASLRGHLTLSSEL